MKKIEFVLTGIAPLMMHNERLANPRDPKTAELKTLTSQKKKTPEIQDQIAKLEWFAGLYDDGKKVVVPADNILATVKEAARKRKLGKQVEAGVFSEKKSFALDYEGPKDIKKLWDDGRFFDYRSVALMGKRTMRARPRFDEWQVKAELVFDPELISESDLSEAIATAGAQVGLCEKRPQFGRFSVEVTNVSDV